MRFRFPLLFSISCAFVFQAHAQTAPPSLPTAKGVPTWDELKSMQWELKQVPILPLTADVNPENPMVVPLPDDWTTQGAWLGRYGKYWAVLFASVVPDDYEWGSGYGEGRRQKAVLLGANWAESCARRQGAALDSVEQNAPGNQFGNPQSAPARPRFLRFQRLARHAPPIRSRRSRRSLSDHARWPRPLRVDSSPRRSIRFVAL